MNRACFCKNTNKHEYNIKQVPSYKSKTNYLQMKRSIIIIIIILKFFPLLLFAQKDIPKNSINFGIGYFADVLQFISPGFGYMPDFMEYNPELYGRLLHGHAMRSGYERLLNTGFILSINLYMAKVNSYYNDPLGLFWDDHKIDYYFVSEVSISKDLLKNENFSLMPNIGLFHRRLYLDRISYLFEVQNNEIFISNIEPQKVIMNDLGLSFGVDFRYNFKNRFFAGVSLRSNLVFDIGIETINISPIWGVRF